MSNAENIIEKVKKLTVKVTLNIGNVQEIGTGVILEINEKIYILTVNHVIFGKKGTYQIKINNVTINCYNDYNPNIVDIIPLDNIVLIEIETINFDLPTVKYLNQPYLDESYHLRGFPKGIIDGSSFPFIANCTDINDILNLTLNINNINGDTSSDDAIEKIQGLSGSGVFFEKLGKIYLVGLVNSLIDSHAIFNAVKAVTLIDLYKSELDFTFYEYKTIDNLSQEFRELNKRVEEEQFKNFQNENENYKNLDRKNKTIYYNGEFFERNIDSVSHFENGKIALKKFFEIHDFENEWDTLMIDTLNDLKKYTPYIENKTIGQDRMLKINEDIKSALINKFPYIEQHSSIVVQLTNYLIAKWLLDCRIDFVKVENEE